MIVSLLMKVNPTRDRVIRMPPIMLVIRFDSAYPIAAITEPKSVKESITPA